MLPVVALCCAVCRLNRRRCVRIRCVLSPRCTGDCDRCTVGRRATDVGYVSAVRSFQGVQHSACVAPLVVCCSQSAQQSTWTGRDRNGATAATWARSNYLHSTMQSTGQHAQTVRFSQTILRLCITQQVRCSLPSRAVTARGSRLIMSFLLAFHRHLIYAESTHPSRVLLHLFLHCGRAQ